MQLKYTYQDRAERDSKARKLRGKGFTVRKRSARNQLLSPNYVADADLSAACPNGFGGYDKTYFAALYIVEAN